MATATSPNVTGAVGGLQPRLSASKTAPGKSATSLSRGSSPLDQVGDKNVTSQNNLKPGMPAEQSTPMMAVESPDLTSLNPKPSPSLSAGFASLASFAGSILPGSSSGLSEDAARRQKLDKYKKKLRENLAEQEALVNKRIAAAAGAMTSGPSQRAVREFEQKIHVLAGKAQKLGRSIGQLESQINMPQETVSATSGQQLPAVASRPSTHSLGVGQIDKAPSIAASSHHTPLNPVTPSGPQQVERSSDQHPQLQRAVSSSSSHSQSAAHTGGSGGPGSTLPVGPSVDKAATLPIPSSGSSGIGSRVFRDVKESITSTFRLRPSQTTQEQLGSSSNGGSASGPRKFGSADNLHNLNLSNISSSSGSCETAGSGVAPRAPPAKSVNLHPQTTHHHAGAVLSSSAIPGMAFEKAKSTIGSSNTHSGVPGRSLPAPPEKRDATLPARLGHSLSIDAQSDLEQDNTIMPLHHQQSITPTVSRQPLVKMLSLFLPGSENEHQKTSFKYAPGDEASGLPPPSATSISSGIHVLDEGTIADDSASQMTGGSGGHPVPFSQSYHFQSGSPHAVSFAVGPRELQELKDLRSDVEHLRHQFDKLDRHWNDKLENLRVELTDVKYLLAAKASHDDIQLVNRRCEDYSASANEAIEHVRNDVILTRQEFSRQDQDLDNAIERLRRRVEELDFDAVATRLTLLEAKVSQVSNYVPGPEPSLKNVAAKLLNVLFALVALVLLLFSTALSMAAPFIRTRIRVIFSAVLAVVLAICYHFWLWRLFVDEDSILGLNNNQPVPSQPPHSLTSSS